MANLGKLRILHLRGTGAGTNNMEVTWRTIANRNIFIASLSSYCQSNDSGLDEVALKEKGGPVEPTNSKYV